jgi:nucleotide-binding universal stress UspA family protein
VPKASTRDGRPVLLCYDGSDLARAMIEQSAAALGGGQALVATVFESTASSLLRRAPSNATQLGRDFREISEEVVNELDAGLAERAQALAAEGAQLAAEAGFGAKPLARRALSKAVERDTATVWRALVEIAEEHDAAVIVVGRRGLSGIGSALLGSVSYGLVHNSSRPVLVIPPPEAGTG